MYTVLSDSGSDAALLLFYSYVDYVDRISEDYVIEPTNRDTEENNIIWTRRSFTLHGEEKELQKM